MKEKILLFLLLVFLSLLQSTLFSFNLVLLMVISYGVLRSPRTGFFWAVLAGVVLDLVVGKTLGFSSLAFLLIIFLLNLYKTKFQAANFVYLLPFTFLSSGVYNFIRSEPFSPVSMILTALLLFLIWPVMNFWIVEKEKDSLQLPLKI